MGLCVSFYDFLDVQDAYVYPAEGSCHQVARFRLVVYRPFVGEVLQGTVAHSDAEGIKVSMGFFDDIHVPARSLRQPASFNPTKEQWTWHYHGDAQAGEDDQDLSIVLGDCIRFKVTDCIFTLVTRSMRERRVTSSTSSSAMSSELGAGAGVAGLPGQGRVGGGFFGVREETSTKDENSGMSVLSAPHLQVQAFNARQRSTSNVGFTDDKEGLGKEALALEQPAMQIVGDIGSDDGLGMLEWW